MYIFFFNTHTRTHTYICKAGAVFNAANKIVLGLSELCNAQHAENGWEMTKSGNMPYFLVFFILV